MYCICSHLNTSVETLKIYRAVKCCHLARQGTSGSIKHLTLNCELSNFLQSPCQPVNAVLPTRRDVNCAE